MSDNLDWGVDSIGRPLRPPELDIPEEEREILVDTPGLTMWTRRRADDE